MFLFYGTYFDTSKAKHLYILNGGKLQMSCYEDDAAIAYYYEHMEQYAENIHKLLDRYTGAQERISQFIKNIGGIGKIHGCIVDVEMPSVGDGFSYAHLFVNPLDGTVTPYFAWDTKSRIVYKDLPTLLKSHGAYKTLFSNYNKLIMAAPESLPALRYGSSITEWGEDDTVFDEGGYLYKISRIIKSLQYCSEKNIIRVWNEKLLNHDFVQTILISEKSCDVMNDDLITMS